MRSCRSDVLRLMQYFNSNSACSAHGSGILSTCSKHSVQNKALSKDYAFEFKSSNLRFGRGVTSEVGMDVINMIKKCVISD